VIEVLRALIGWINAEIRFAIFKLRYGSKSCEQCHRPVAFVFGKYILCEFHGRQFREQVGEMD
jgi:hypothetical protein